MINNSLDKQYLDILKDVVYNGVEKGTRNSVTTSVFGRTIRHNFNEGFPIYTTKLMSFKTVLTELRWFLLGRTDLKWLVDRKCFIWVGDAYKRYKEAMNQTFPWLTEEELEGDVTDETFKDLDELNAGKLNIVTIEMFTKLIQEDEKFSNLWGDLGVIYGAQWRDFGSSEGSGNNVDQIKTLIKTLAKDPNSRRSVVSAWNPAELPNMVLPPCHMFFQTYTAPLNFSQKALIAIAKNIDIEDVKDVGLSLQFYCRSQDLFLGTPYNTVSYGILLVILSKILGFEEVDLIHVMGDTHIYESHYDAVDTQLKNLGHPLPILRTKGIFDNILDYWIDEETFDIDRFITELDHDDFELIGYKHDGAIKAELIN